MPFVSTNGVTLRYEVTGKGPPLCLIIGYRLNGEAWPAAFIESLAHRYTVLTLDNRGTGLSEKPETGYSISVMAADVSGLLSSVGLAPAHVLGFSMGGAIAQELAIREPEKVARLVLFSTFAGGLFGIPASWRVLRKLIGIEALPPEEAARVMRPLTYSSEYLANHSLEVEKQMRREIVHPTPPHAARGHSAAIRTFSSGLRLSQIRTPTLVVTGAEDILVPAANSRVLAGCIPRARLALIPQLGHRAIWEAPDEMALLVGDFLSADLCSS